MEAPSRPASGSHSPSEAPGEGSQRLRGNGPSSPHRTGPENQGLIADRGALTPGNFPDVKSFYNFVVREELLCNPISYYAEYQPHTGT